MTTSAAAFIAMAPWIVFALAQARRYFQRDE